MGSYTKLDSFSTRNGNMLHYVVFREVKPEPDPDPTALWFKIGGKILRFSRTEYALVSGLRFGQAKFNPYRVHTVPEESVFARLFRYNEKTTTADVARMFNRMKFTYTEWEGDKKKEIEIPATTEDFVKVAKLLLASTYALGYEQTKKAIPIWLWVLLENKDEWEEFPWGSYSYQALTDSITSVMKKDRVPKSGKVSYHIKGNTIAFSVSFGYHLSCTYFFIYLYTNNTSFLYIYRPGYLNQLQLLETLSEARKRRSIRPAFCDTHT